MDPTFIQWLVGQSGLAGLAALALWLNSRQAQEAIRRERETGEQLRALNGEVMRALTENTRAITALQSAIGELMHDNRERTSAPR